MLALHRLHVSVSELATGHFFSDPTQPDPAYL